MKRPLDLLAFGNVAIDLEHSPVSKQLLTTVNDYLVSILADMSQFARPIAVVSKLRSHFGELDWELGLQ